MEAHKSDAQKVEALAQILIDQKEITQVIAQETPDEDPGNDDEDTDDNIYGVSSVVDLHQDCGKNILEFVEEKCPGFKKIKEELEDGCKIGFIINERYINLPAQLSLPTFKILSESLQAADYTHLIFISKILVRSKSEDTSLPSKKMKSQHAGVPDSEPLIFINPEEEIIFEQAIYHSDVDVSAHCDENASWFFGSDVRYKPHRRIMILDYKDWPKTMDCLTKELNQEP